MGIKINKEIARLVRHLCPVNLTIVKQGSTEDMIYFDVIEESDSVTYAETGLNQLSQIVISHFNFVTVKYMPYELNDDGIQVWTIEFYNLILDDAIFELADFYCPVKINMTCSSFRIDGVSCEFMDVCNDEKRAILGAYKIIDIITDKYPFLSHRIQLYDRKENEEQMFCIDFLYE